MNQSRPSLISIISEPKGASYEALLKFAATRCKTFSLVWRYRLRPKPGSDEMLGTLEEFLISERDRNQWPGTQLLNGKATVRHYRMPREVLPVLVRVGSLYSWLHPQHPEDLACYRPNGKNWLASIAHEKEAWITDSRLSTETLLDAVPGVQFE